MDKLKEVLDDWEGYANSVFRDERNEDLQTALMRIRETFNSYASEPCQAHDPINAGCCCVKGWLCGEKPCMITRDKGGM